jgi:hypothetical protein
LKKEIKVAKWGTQKKYLKKKKKELSLTHVKEKSRQSDKKKTKKYLADEIGISNHFVKRFVRATKCSNLSLKKPKKDKIKNEKINNRKVTGLLHNIYPTKCTYNIRRNSERSHDGINLWFSRQTLCSYTYYESPEIFFFLEMILYLALISCESLFSKTEILFVDSCRIVKYYGFIL